MDSTEEDETPSFVYRGRSVGGAVAPYGITFYGAVDDDSAATFEEALRYVEARVPARTPVPLMISSPGGDVYAALKMVDLMEASSLTFHTIAAGACMSAAALVFSFGARRYVGPRATIMLHGVRMDFMEGKLKDVEVEATEMRRLNTMMWTLMSKNIGQDDEFLQNRLDARNTDCYFSPAAALELGLATDIGVPVLEAHREVRLEVRYPDKVADGKENTA